MAPESLSKILERSLLKSHLEVAKKTHDLESELLAHFPESLQASCMIAGLKPLPPGTHHPPRFVLEVWVKHASIGQELLFYSPSLSQAVTTFLQTSLIASLAPHWYQGHIVKVQAKVPPMSHYARLWPTATMTVPHVTHTL